MRDGRLKIDWNGTSDCNDCYIINRLFNDLCIDQLRVKFPKGSERHLLIDKENRVIRSYSNDQWVDCIGRNLANDYNFRYVGYNPARE